MLRKNILSKIADTLDNETITLWYPLNGVGIGRILE